MKHKMLFLGLCLFSNSGPLFAAEAKNEKVKVIEVSVTEEGFLPNTIDAAAGDEVTLMITRKTDATCATSVMVPKRKIKEPLPLNRAVEIKLGRLETGKVRFGCGMGMMMGAVINVESNR